LVTIAKVVRYQLSESGSSLTVPDHYLETKTRVPHSGTLVREVTPDVAPTATSGVCGSQA